MTEYHNIEKCRQCEGENDLVNPSCDEAGVYESETKCLVCGFMDYWAYGFFQSTSETREINNAKSYMIALSECLNETVRERDNLRAICLEATNYLDLNELTNIGHGSIFHKMFKEGARDK